MLAVAIPDSSLAEEDTLRDKSIKASRLARIFAIFGINSIYIYRDLSSDYSKDRRLLKLVLEYMDTPQYLRKRLYAKVKELKYAGLFPPLKAPHHKPYIRLEDVNIGDVRQGVVVKRVNNASNNNASNNSLYYYVDVGLDTPIPLHISKDEHVNIGKRVTVVFTSRYPNLACRLAKYDEIREYWGYNVVTAGSLSSLLTIMIKRKMLIIITSKYGKNLKLHEHEIASNYNNSNKYSGILLVFGSPYRDIHEIIKDEHKSIKQFTSNVYNFFPCQKVESIRLDEAILGCLSIINYIIKQER
jgi:predicted SPOUT superfamily RNA methylase MTH1